MDESGDLHPNLEPTDAMLTPTSKRNVAVPQMDVETPKPTAPAPAPRTRAARPRSSRKAPVEATAAATSATVKNREDGAMSRSDAPAPKARARHAHLFVTHVDPWSVMKNAFMFSLAVAIVMIVAVTILWSMLSLSGTLAGITRTLTDIAGGGANTLDAASLFSFSRVVGVTGVLALLEVVLLTALATLFAFLYNLSVGVTGGFQVTLTDDS